MVGDQTYNGSSHFFTADISYGIIWDASGTDVKLAAKLIGAVVT